jgi:SAM-dependent methyltransferase
MSSTASQALCPTLNEIRCKVCFGGSVDYLCDTPNGHGVTELIRNYRCRTCGLVFVGNRFEDDELGDAYSTLESSAYYAEIADENRKKMGSAVSDLRKIVDPTLGEVIDIGTGDATFLNVLHQAGFRNVSGHEIPGADLSSVSDIAKRVYEDFDYRSIPSESYDVVTLLDVVEHVREPQYLIDQCYRILKPGGYIYFHTPVVTRTDRIMHGLMRFPVTNGPAKLWQRGRMSIFHLQNYTRTSLAILLKRGSFELVSLEVRNELSWPLRRYVRVFFIDRMKLPRIVTEMFVPVFYPFLATNFFNSNKSIVMARKPLN